MNTKSSKATNLDDVIGQQIAKEEVLKISS